MMDDDDDNNVQQRTKSIEVAGPAMGPLYLSWEGSLERLKLMNYERDYCRKLNKKPFSRVHFVIPGNNASHQFDDFVSLCSWLSSIILGKNDAFKREEFDDPNTVVNKLMLVLRQMDFRSTFAAQKLKVAYGEATCHVLDFLTEKLMLSRGLQWESPLYQNDSETNEERLGDALDADDIDEDELLDLPQDDDALLEEAGLPGGAGNLESSLEQSSHNILRAAVDPMEWKTELERVGPKLRANQHFSSNEWRSHVDQTLASKEQIGKVLSETQVDLQAMYKQVADELNKMRMKEKYLSNQYNALGLEYVEVKHRLEEVDTKNSSAHEVMARLTSELAELSERLDELKESFESKDSGLHDTSPLVKLKAALQQVKAEIHGFDMRIGVVSHSLLSARTSDSNRLRSLSVNKSRQRHNKNKKQNMDDNSILSDN